VKKDNRSGINSCSLYRYAQRGDDTYCLIEIGDGQIIGKKTWPIDVFCSILLNNIEPK